MKRARICDSWAKFFFKDILLYTCILSNTPCSGVADFSFSNMSAFFVEEQDNRRFIGGQVLVVFTPLLEAGTLVFDNDAEGVQLFLLIV